MVVATPKVEETAAPKKAAPKLKGKAKTAPEPEEVPYFEEPEADNSTFEPLDLSDVTAESEAAVEPDEPTEHSSTLAALLADL